jgi:hypothetical protein
VANGDTYSGDLQHNRPAPQSVRSSRRAMHVEEPKSDGSYLDFDAEEEVGDDDEPGKQYPPSQ